MERPRQRQLTAGALGGVLALTASLAGVISQLIHGGPLSNTTGLTIVLVFLAGVLAVLQPRQIETMALATVLVGISVIMELFGRLGTLYLPSLLLLMFGTMRSEEAPEREETVPRHVAPTSRPRLAPEFGRHRQARTDALRGSRAPETLRRTG